MEPSEKQQRDPPDSEDGLIEELQKQVRDRFKNPLLLAFALAWFGFNYESFIFYFSDIEPAEKINAISALYSETNAQTGQLELHPYWKILFGPLISSTLFVLIYPLINLPLSSYWRYVQELTNKAWRYINRERLLGLEESTKLIEENEQLQNQINSLEDQTQELLETIENLTSGTPEEFQNTGDENSSNELEEAADLASESSDEDTERKEASSSRQTKSIFHPEAIASAAMRTNPIKVRLSELEHNLIKVFGDNDKTTLGSNELKKILKFNVESVHSFEMDSALENLQRLELLTYFAPGRTYELTTVGKAYYVDFALPSKLKKMKDQEIRTLEENVISHKNRRIGPPKTLSKLTTSIFLPEPDDDDIPF